jgi:hypothetical protein
MPNAAERGFEFVTAPINNDYVHGSIESGNTHSE